MDRTVDLSVAPRTGRYLFAGLFSFWVIITLFALVVGVTSIEPTPAVLAFVLGVRVSFVVTWVRRADGSAEGTAWGGVPRWQYGSRFSKSGGHAGADRRMHSRSLGRTSDG
jgi:hypothetical protein